MTVHIEFYGIPRQRAGVGTVDVEARTLGDALHALTEQLPNFARACLANGRLQPGYLANINGDRFTSDPATPLKEGDAVLILSADVGG